MTANTGVYTYPMHRDQHGWVKPSDCPFCAGETYRATQEMDAWEAARRNHPSNRGRTPGNLAYWDQVNAARRDEEWSAARAITFAVLLVVAFATAVPGALNFWTWVTYLDTQTVHNFAWLPLFSLTALAVYGLTRIGKP